MLLVLIIWALIFLVFFVTGSSVVKVIYAITRQRNNSFENKPDELFFLGFLTLSTMAGLLSVFIPIGNNILISLGILALLLLVINYKEIQVILRETAGIVAGSNKLGLAVLLLLIIFILTAVVQKITLGDTQSYHAQSIQWVRKLAVVPGLGNIHGRLAFNSMFFVISGLFTFQIKDILIFPLNGISYIVLIFKLVSEYKKHDVQGNRWKSMFYIIILLISLFVFIPNLNSPSPDIICAVLIIYSFTLILDLKEKDGQLNFGRIILLNLMVFSCISFKISSLFMVSTLLILLNKEILKRTLITLSIGIIVLSSFVIRNYYLSGYLIYPFPSLDIFNPDWKIPLDDVISMKLEIESWARISDLPVPDVAHMKFTEWIMPWFKSLDLFSKILLTINSFSLITVIIMLLKRDFFLVKIQLIILLNLFFWLLMAPDPRFAYGFIFLGFSLNISYLFKLLESSSFMGILKYYKVVLACLLILIVYKRAEFPLETVKNSSLWMIPASFDSVETNEFNSDFKYRVPVPGGGCFNVEIPCVPFPLTNIALRANDLQDGFKVVKQDP